LRTSIWPPFFAFILALLLMIWAYNPSYIAATLIFIGAWFTMLLYIALVAIVGALMVLAWLVYARIQNQQNRPVDGAYPLQRFRVRGGRTVVINPTHMMSAAAVIDRRTGDYTEIEHPAGWDVVAPLRHAIERSNSIRAMFPGDAARMNQNGAMSRMPSMAGVRQLEAKAPAAPRVVGAPPPVERVAPPREPLSLPAAFKRSEPEKWIIGQNPEAGTLATIQPRQSVHAGIIGATGTGKTASLGFLIAAYAIRHGWHTVILDPKGGADWEPWSRHAEWHESDRTTFPDQVRAIEAEHDRRYATVKAAHVPDVGQLRTPPPPVLVVVEEYGDLIDQLRKAKRSEAEAVDTMLDRLLRLSRMTDIHLLFIDQYPEHWSNQVIAGTKAKAVFQLGPNQGAKLEEYKASKLPDCGRFLLRGKEYDAWHVAPDVAGILRALPARRGVDIVGVQYGVDGVQDGVRDGGGRSNTRDSDTGERANEQPAPKWDDVTAAFFSAHPDLLTGPARGITDLARLMAESEGNAKPHTAYKSIAHAYFHQFRAAVRLPSGAPLGVDVTEAR
jgi:hypothetical protein